MSLGIHFEPMCNPETGVHLADGCNNCSTDVGRKYGRFVIGCDVSPPSERMLDNTNKEGRWGAFKRFYIPTPNSLIKAQVINRLSGLANRIQAAENLDELDNVMIVRLIEAYRICVVKGFSKYEEIALMGYRAAKLTFDGGEGATFPSFPGPRHTPRT